MAVPSVALALVLLAAWLALARAGRLTDRAVVDLQQVAPDAAPPSVSIVVPCRDEAEGVEAALRSLLAQDLPALEVVAVDDRSSDGTGAILDRLAAADPRLTVVRVASLPPGWLGKNHACERGASAARGEWLLFTDADVVFAPDALRRALAHARRLRLGHLAASPRFVAPGLLERAFVGTFAAFAAAAFRCWELPRGATRGFIGVGAFNLVRAASYRAVGGHRRLALEVLDDAKLGLLLRRSGVPQGFVSGGSLVQVRWHPGFRATVAGLMKNLFAAAEYRLGLALGAAAWLLLLGAGPVVLLGWAPAAPARAAAAAALLLAAGVSGATARRVAGGSGVEGLLAPLAVAALGAVLAASALAAHLRGAVVWRGTRYPLAMLREGCVRAADLPTAGAVGWPGAPCP